MNNEGKIKTFIFLFIFLFYFEQFVQNTSSKYLIMNAYLYIHMLMYAYI